MFSSMVFRLRSKLATRLMGRHFTSSSSLLQSKPWYLNVVESKAKATDSPFIKAIAFPETKVPSSVKKISSYLNDKLAITDIIVFDTKHSNATTSIQRMADFVLIGSVKSFKHLQNSNDELIKFVKNEFGQFPKSEGLVTSGILKRRQKRIGRKTNIGKLAAVENNDSGWCLIDSRVDGLFINILTDQRRKELNLEELYCRQDEMEKYVKREETELKVSEEDDVLLGLRKLMMKNTKRFYTTEVSSEQNFFDALTIQDFSTAKLLLEKEVKAYSTIVSVLSSLPSNIELDKEKWIELFDKSCPNGILDDEYWATRFKFFELLYTSKRNKVLYSEDVDITEYRNLNKELNNFINGYFRFKQQMFCQPTREEFIQFLEICVEQIKVLPKYSHLVSINSWIVKGLQSFQFSDPEIVHDSRVIRLLVKSMYVDNINLHALYEYVSLISSELQLQKLSTSTITEIINTLAESQSWSHLFNFWKICLLEQGNSTILWTSFIRACLNSNNSTILRQLMDKGHLLWIYRYKVKVDGELRLALEELFDRVDGSYDDLKKLLNL